MSLAPSKQRQTVLHLKNNACKVRKKCDSIHGKNKNVVIDKAFLQIYPVVVPFKVKQLPWFLWAAACRHYSHLRDSCPLDNCIAVGRCSRINNVIQVGWWD